MEEEQGLWSNEMAFIYMPEGTNEAPFFHFRSFAKSKEDAGLVLYMHWIVKMLAMNYDVPGVRVRGEGE